MLPVLLTRGRQTTPTHASIIYSAIFTTHARARAHTHALRGDLDSNQPNEHVSRLGVFYFKYLFLSLSVSLKIQPFSPSNAESAGKI